MWLNLLYYVIVLLISELLRPKPDLEDAKPSGLGDFNFPTATEGRVVPLIWGTNKLEGPNVVWYGDLTQQPIKEKVKTGLFSSEHVIIGFKYLIGIQFALCRGECELLRIWIGDDEIFSGSITGTGVASLNEPTFYGGDDLGNGGIVGDFRFFSGSETQVASTYLSDFQEEGGDTPAYRGTTYGVFEHGYIGNSTNIKPWAFELRRIPVGLGVTNSTVNSGNDASIPHVIYEILTNTEWGMGLDPADIDTVNFAAVAAVLVSEGNGFSMVLDRVMETGELIRLLEQQMQGKLFLNQLTGKWQIKLARFDYTPSSLPLLDKTNIKATKNYSAGSWDQTSNNVRVDFVDRALDYKQTGALAQDMANHRVQNKVISSPQSFPGVKDATLANNLAWRELRNLSTPMAKVSVTVDRSFWDLQAFSSVRWTDEELDIEEAIMRVMSVDLGTLNSDEIELELARDIFSFKTPSFSAPPGTGWVAPQDTMVAVPSNEQVVMEAPRAFLTRDPELTGAIAEKIWAGAHNQAGETAYDVVERHHPTSPSGAFSPAGQIYGSFLIGELNGSLDRVANPSTISLTPDIDTQADILAAMPSVTDPELGVELASLIMIDDEIILVKASAANGANIDLTNCRRGALDTTQDTHANGARVYLLSVNGSLTETIFPAGDVVHIKLQPKSPTDTLPEGSATQITVDLDFRLQRPYPPAEMELNNTVYPSSSVSLDSTAPGTGFDGVGILLQYIRRDYRTGDELAAVTDESSLPADFPTANNTEYEVEVRNDPNGTNTLLFTIPYGTAQNDHPITRTQILAFTDGVVPTRMRLVVNTQHDHETTSYESMQPLVHDFDVDSATIEPLDNLGALDDSEVSNSFLANDTGTYQFDIGTDLLTSGAVEARINAGVFVPVITSGGGTTGTLLGVTSGDTIEVRHTQTGSNNTYTQLIVKNNAAANIAQGILIV